LSDIGPLGSEDLSTSYPSAAYFLITASRYAACHYSQAIAVSFDIVHLMVYSFHVLDIKRESIQVDYAMKPFLVELFILEWLDVDVVFLLLVFG